jgi:hypothetical protein
LKIECENFDLDLSCSDLSSCSYDLDLNYLIYLGDLNSAFRKRECFNSTFSWVEKQACSLKENVVVEKCEDCLDNSLVIKNSETGEILALVSFSESEELDIKFFDKEPLPFHCYNGVLDGDETGIDCGGSCEKCLELFYVSPINYPAWISFILAFIVLFFLERVVYSVDGLRFLGIREGGSFVWEKTGKKFLDWLFYSEISSEQDISKVKVIYFKRSLKKK